MAERKLKKNYTERSHFFKNTSELRAYKNRSNVGVPDSSSSRQQSSAHSTLSHY